MGFTFVAGGTGFVGRQFVAAASEAGLELCVLTRDSETAARFERRGIRAVVGDLLTSGAWQTAAAQAETAVYAAGPPTWGRRLSRRSAHRYRDGMTAMTRSFFTSLNADRLERVVYLAGASYYGDTGGTPATEEQAPRPKGTGPYIAPAIDVARSFSERLPTVITLPGAVYGPGSWLSQLVLKPLHRGKAIYALNGHEPAISVVHGEDCAGAHVHLLQHGTPGEAYFVADDEPMTLEAILHLAAELTGIPYRQRKLPRWLCQLAIGPILTDAATASCVVSNDKLKRSGFALRYRSMKDGLGPVITEWRRLHDHAVEPVGGGTDEAR